MVLIYGVPACLARPKSQLAHSSPPIDVPYLGSGADQALMQPGPHTTTVGVWYVAKPSRQPHFMSRILFWTLCSYSVLGTIAAW